MVPHGRFAELHATPPPCRYVVQLYFPADWSYVASNIDLGQTTFEPYANPYMPVMLQSFNSSLLPYVLGGHVPRAGTTTLISDQQQCGDKVMMMGDVCNDA